MSSRPNGSPPPYESDGYNAPAQPAYSYYPDDEFQHFYRWTSPPGILKIMSIITIVLCVAIFACVASTLAWDSQGALSGFGGLGGGFAGGVGGGFGGGFGSFGSGGVYGPGNNYGYAGIGGNYNDPRTGKGFIIAMAAITFIAALAIFIIIVSHQSISESRKFYLAVIIICAILALLMLIAAICYLMAVNPMAQSQGSAYGSQIAGLCAQYQRPQPSGVFVNQYLYHYCVVEPQEAIAVVFGFLVVVALIIMLVFALKTRKKISNFGKSNILWKRVKMVDDDGEPPQDVEAWVNNVSVPPEDLPMSDFPEKMRSSRNHLDDESTNYSKPHYSYTPPPVEDEQPLNNGAPYSANSDVPSSAGRSNMRRPGRDRDADYASSGDELDDDDDFYSEFPPIANEQERNEYKREFDRDHQEYKDLQADLDAINKKLSEVDRELDDLQEGSPQYLDALDEYNRIKDLKKSADYRARKRRSKSLKAKLNHIKKMVSDYDRRA
ncbi:occludin [Dunckerocampus dactyliophorus]|uniref:occludin n=1 Tax=Dunckerocampus dactyliophorus TaxID=161453 RepID=UPI0024057850|nr:occludin [Dunckerocampus dactyliophorus]XP_054612225.1 occludin [Dunckerocampus dactyliophorus]XP_054612226.1 occludin [Dunckerocampus dactyliophorus]